jgi:hypothetical protein
VVPLRLHSAVTEAGALEIEARSLDGTEHWKVEFDMRADRKGAEPKAA